MHKYCDEWFVFAAESDSVLCVYGVCFVFRLLFYFPTMSNIVFLMCIIFIVMSTSVLPVY